MTPVWAQRREELLSNWGIHVRRDELVSVVYSTELNSTTSLASPQRTDRYGSLDEKPPHFQRLSR